jgi:hypothetical protein
MICQEAVIASEAFSPREGGGKQSRAARTAPSALDCFVASLLAMTRGIVYEEPISTPAATEKG